MKRGFTIIELLVASALLGLLVTILTMIFNQSSIAWQTGIQGVANMAKMRTRYGISQEQLDNAVVLPGSDDKVYRLIGLWSGTELRNRAINTKNLNYSGVDSASLASLSSELDGKELNSLPRTKTISTDGSASGTYTYMVNVKSGGPHNDIERYDAIWSAPDDTSEW